MSLLFCTQPSRGLPLQKNICLPQALFPVCRPCDSRHPGLGRRKLYTISRWSLAQGTHRIMRRGVCSLPTVRLPFCRAQRTSPPRLPLKDPARLCTWPLAPVYVQRHHLFAVQ